MGYILDEVMVSVLLAEQEDSSQEEGAQNLLRKEDTKEEVDLVQLMLAAVVVEGPAQFVEIHC